MFWYPDTGAIPYDLIWPAGLFATALAVAAFVGAVRVALLALRPPSSEAVSAPRDPEIVEDLSETRQDAA